MDFILELIVRLMVWLSRWASPLSRCGIIRYERWQPGEKLKILLVGYNGARNTGADARVVALVEQLLAEYGEENISLTVMTLNADNIKGYFPECVNILQFPTFFCWALFRAASSHHAAILCEGSMLTHTFADALSMFFCQAAGIMRRQQKPCVAYGSDVAPLHSRLARLAKDMCSEVLFISRSQTAHDVLTYMGFECVQGTDTAWTLRIDEKDDTGKDLISDRGWDGKRPLLGVAVINPYCWPVTSSLTKWIKAMCTGQRSLQYDKMYFFSDSAERRAAYHKYLSGMAEGVREYRRKHDAFVVIIGMEQLDGKACADLQSLIGGDSAIITSRETDVFHMTSVLHCLDALVTSRYHAAVLSMLRGGMPVVAVSMDNRLDGLFRELHFDSRYLHHVSDSDLAMRISRSLAMAEEDKDRIVENIRANVEKNKRMLKKMGSYLSKLRNSTGKSKSLKV